jgi:hypothetical protein
MRTIHGRPDLFSTNQNAELAADLRLKKLIQRRVTPAQTLRSRLLQENMRAHRGMAGQILPDQPDKLVVNRQNVGLGSDGQNAPFVETDVKGRSLRDRLPEPAKVLPYLFALPALAAFLIISHDDEKRNRRQEQDEDAEKDLHPSHLIAKNGNHFAFLPRSGDYRSDLIMAASSLPFCRPIAFLLSYLSRRHRRSEAISSTLPRAIASLPFMLSCCDIP